MSRPPDPRTVDATARHALPYPIAAVYRLAQSSHQDADRYGYRVKLVASVLRFLALTSLADALANAPSAKEVKSWLLLLRNPGHGKYLALLRETARAKGARRVPELVELVEEGHPWQRAASELTSVRNRLAHDEVHVPQAEAGPKLRRLEPLVQELLAHILFLREYQLGYFAQTGTKFHGSRYYWYGTRGSDEHADPVELVTQHSLCTDYVALLDLRTGQGLYLSPFVRYALAQADEARHYLVLHDLELEDEQPTGWARYLHPILRQQAVFGFGELASGEEALLDEFLATPSIWPQAFPASFDRARLDLMRSPPPPRGFDERFELRGRLGAGGMGQVWEVFDRALQQERALKVLDSTLSRDVRYLERFNREAHLLAGVKHPRVVRVFDIGFNPDHAPFLLMELVVGETLEQLVQRRGPLPLEEALPIMAEALEAVQAVHDAGIIHRDVKPANFMYEAVAGVRLIDFGIAIRPTDARLTTPLDRMGTPGYAAPEQQDNEFSVRTDIFGAACVLFYLLVGRPPKAKERLRDANPDVPSEVDRVFLRATDGEPSERYASASLFAAALDAAWGLARTATQARLAHGYLPRWELPEACRLLHDIEATAPTLIARGVWSLGVGRDPGSRLVQAYEITKLVLEHYEAGQLLQAAGVGTKPTAAPRVERRAHAWLSLRDSSRLSMAGFARLVESAEELRTLRNRALTGVEAGAQMHAESQRAIQSLAEFLTLAEDLYRHPFAIVAKGVTVPLRGHHPSLWSARISEREPHDVVLLTSGEPIPAYPIVALADGWDGVPIIQFAHSDERGLWYRTAAGALVDAPVARIDRLAQDLRELLAARGAGYVPRRGSMPPTTPTDAFENLPGGGHAPTQAPERSRGLTRGEAPRATRADPRGGNGGL